MNDQNKNVKSLREKGPHAQAIQYTGKNAAEIISVVPSCYMKDGKLFIAIFNNGTAEITKGDWLVFHMSGKLSGTYEVVSNKWVKMRYEVK